MTTRHRRLAALVFFAALSIVHTWPLAFAPAVYTRHDNADTYLNQWILAWIAHVLPRDPLHLFEANIFYPAPHTLAYSEHLVVQGVMGAPLAWLGASPVLAYNVVLLAGLTLTGWTTSLVVASWTGDALAGLLAGSLAAFNTHTLSRIAHVQAAHVEFLPLALFALDRLLRDPRIRRAWALGAWSALQMLCSGYLLVFTVVALGAGLLARAREWLAPRCFSRAAPPLALAAVLAAILCVPFLIPYAQVHAEQHLTRSLDDAAEFSISLKDYLATVGVLHYKWWSYRFYRGADPMFPGMIPIALALVALLTGRAWNEPRARMVAAAGLASFGLSFGPAFAPYRWLYAALPVMQGIRGPGRFGYIVIFATGILAGFGLEWLRSRARTVRRRSQAAAVCAAIAIGLTNLESLTAPRDDLTRSAGIPHVYDVLRDEPGAVVAEFPFWPSPELDKHAVYVFNSTRHWARLVNGYSGFKPPDFPARAEILGTFPDEQSLALLRSLGVTHVVVHLDQDVEVAKKVETLPDFEQIAVSRDIRIYRVRR